MLNHIKAAGIVPKKRVLINKCSAKMKAIIRKMCQLKILQSYCHRQTSLMLLLNISRRIFYSFLAGVDDYLPKFLWDKLLLQAELTVNLLQQANVNAKLSAHSYLCSPFEYNHFSWTMLGYAIQVHIPPDFHSSLGNRERKVWCIRCAWDHYQLHMYDNRMTKRDKVLGAVKFKHKSRTNSSLTGKNELIRAYHYFESKMTGKPNTQGTADSQQLQALAETIEDFPYQHNKMDANKTSVKLN